MSDQDYHNVGSDLVGARVETSKYTEEAIQDGDYLGYLPEEIDWPNPNPHDQLPHTGGGRGPYTHAPQPKEYEWDLPIVPVDANIPLEIAMGARAETDQTNYTEVLFTEAEKLPTATIWRGHQSMDLQQAYVGTKAGLTISWGMEEALQVTLNAMSGIMNPDTSSFVAPNVDPPVKAPFMGWMQGQALVDGQTVATVQGGDVTLDHGLEVNPHGDAGREGYNVSEETGSEKYDASLTYTVADTYLFQKASQDGALMDIEVPLHRDLTNDPSTDAFILRLKQAKIVDAPVSSPGEGRHVDDVEIAPSEIEIEIRDPL